MDEYKLLWPGLKDYIKFAEALKSRTKNLHSLQGINKLARKINAELKFLISLNDEHDRVTASHLKCSNLGHFASLVHAAERLPGVVAVLQPFFLPSRRDSLVIDIIAGNGHILVKVIARKAQALHLVWAGRGQFGERDLISQAEEYLDCVRLHPHQFRTPQIMFAFYNRVTVAMSEALQGMGIVVFGERVRVDDDIEAKLESALCLEMEEGCQVLGTNEDHPDDIRSRDVKCVDKQDIDNRHVIFPDGGRNDMSSYCDTDFQSNDSYRKRPESTVKIPSIGGQPVTTENTVKMSGIGGQTMATAGQGRGTDSLFTPHPSKHSIQISEPKPHNENSGVILECLGIDRSSNTPSPPSVPWDKTILSTSLESPAVRQCHDLFTDETRQDLFLQLVVSPPVFCPLPGSTSGSASLDSGPPIGRVNLDITTLIALVSSVTNGNCHLTFRDKVLTEQAREERNFPILPDLTAFLQGKKLFVCATAVSSFKAILDILGGVREKERATELLARVDIVKDEPSERSMMLECLGRVKERSKVVFGTGDTLQAVTITANMGFVRAAKSQGVTFPVFLHPARALTEQKEKYSSPL